MACTQVSVLNWNFIPHSPIQSWHLPLKIWKSLWAILIKLTLETLWKFMCSTRHRKDRQSLHVSEIEWLEMIDSNSRSQKEFRFLHRTCDYCFVKYTLHCLFGISQWAVYQYGSPKIKALDYSIVNTSITAFLIDITISIWSWSLSRWASQTMSRKVLSKPSRAGRYTC